MDDHMAPTRRPWKSQAARALFRDYLPAFRQTQRDALQASLATSGWLVTLTTGLLAFLLSRPELIQGATPAERRLYE